MNAIVTVTMLDSQRLLPGSYAALCNIVAMLGLQPTQYGPKPKVYLRFEVPSEHYPDGHPYTLGATLTASLSPKAVLSQWIQAWRGVPFSPEDLKGFDLFKLLGKSCLINVSEVAGGAGTYSVITTLSALLRGMPPLTPHYPLLKYSDNYRGDLDKMPPWIQEKISAQVPPTTAAEPAPAPTPQPFNDDIPF